MKRILLATVALAALLGQRFGGRLAAETGI